MDAEQLRRRIANINAENERLYERSYLGRAWLAKLMADATVIADELERRLNEPSA